MKTPALFLLLFLASCAVPPPPATGGGDLDTIGILAQATADTAGEMARSTEIARAAAQATAQNIEYTSATATRAEIDAATNRRIESTATHAAAIAKVQESEAVSLSQILIRSTAEAEQQKIDNAKTRADRAAWFWDVLAGSFFVFIWVASGVFFTIQLHTKRTRYDNAGNPTVLNGKPVEYEDEEKEYIPRVLTVKKRTGQTQAIEMEEPAFPLTRPNGRAVIYNFSDADIHALKLNLLTGDHGFRRVKSDKGRGMDDLIGLSNGDKYRAILAAMKANGWLCSVGNASQWTNDGAIDVLGLDALPPQNNAGA